MAHKDKLKEGDESFVEIDKEGLNRIAHLFESQDRTDDVGFDIEDSGYLQSTSSSSTLSFAAMGLSVNVLKGLQNAGFQRPSPVQLKAIPLGRMGIDLIVQAKSGTGKTVVFSVVVLEAIDVRKKAVQAIVVSPTREIALQSTSVIRQLGTFIAGLQCKLLVGGLPLSEDVKALESCHIAVGTPGRLKCLIQEGHLNCEHVRLFVLDEADLLFSGNANLSSTAVTSGEGEGVSDVLFGGKNTFPAAVNYLWWALPEGKQVIALSATYTSYLIQHHLPRYLNQPALVQLSAEDPSLLGVKQFFYTIHSKSPSPAAVFKAKVAELLRILKEVDFRQCLIFSNYHNSAEQLCEMLKSAGWPVTYISSSLDQQQRFKAFHSLRAFQCRILVSTDLTARGVDAENVNLVISLEVPWKRDVYLHRIGRAGRFGSYGASILLVSDSSEEMKHLSRIEDPNATPICQLPEPIPVDLATSECVVDVSKLVTVTKLTATNIKRLQPEDIEFAGDIDGSKEEKPVLPNRQQRRQRRSVHHQQQQQERQQLNSKENIESTNPLSSDLFTNLAEYTRMMLKKPCVQLTMTLGDDVDEQELIADEFSPQIDDLEQKTLRCVADFLDGFEDFPMDLENAYVKSELHWEEERQPQTRHFHRKAEKEGIVHEVEKEEEMETCTRVINRNPEENKVRKLTPRQEFFWHEYCRLIGWKDYFYQAWWKASSEYEAELADFKRADRKRSLKI